MQPTVRRPEESFLNLQVCVHDVTMLRLNVFKGQFSNRVIELITGFYAKKIPISQGIDGEIFLGKLSELGFPT